MKINTERAYNMEKDNVYLVYESQLDKLFKTCQVCGEAIIETRKIENEGTQYRRKMTCLTGCQTEWSSQPKATNFKGTNVLLTENLSGEIMLAIAILMTIPKSLL